jgi:hypothetical protein
MQPAAKTPKPATIKVSRRMARDSRRIVRSV